MSPRRSALPVDRPTVAIVLAAGVALIARAWQWRDFVVDDAFISLRYADRLLHGHGLTWTDGPAVEGYTNLLWVLGCAALSPLTGGDLVHAMRALGVGAGLATLAALGSRFRGRHAALAVAALALVASTPFAAWTVGGLEAPLVAAALAGALALLGARVDGEVSARALLAAGLPLAALALTRADAAVLIGGVGLGWLLARPRLATIAEVGTLTLPALVATAGQLTGRIAVYGDVVPNTARVKVAFSPRRTEEGVAYLVEGARHAPLLVVGGVAALLLLGTARRRPALLVALPLATWSAWVAAVGGDLFPADRHTVPLLVLGAFAVGEATALLGRAGWLGLVLVAATPLAERGSTSLLRARDETWCWDGARFAAVLVDAFGDRHPLLAVDAAGTMPFYSRLDALDLLGLNDPWIARHPSGDLDARQLGHGFGDPAYVLRRAPDLVLFTSVEGNLVPTWNADRELVATDAFQRGWAPVRYVTPIPVRGGVVWVRREGRVGVRRSGDTVDVPGFLLATSDDATAVPQADGHLALALPPDRVATLDGLDAGAGPRHVAVVGDPVEVTVIGGERRWTGAGAVDIDVAGPVTLTVRAPPGASPSRVDGVRITPR